MSTSKYKTIAGASSAEFKDRGSKFLAYAFPIGAEKEITEHIDALKKSHAKARHWCYAWRTGLDQNHFRANDDGEPSGTAGRPILGQIDSAGLTQIIIIVVRYFGGTLLGTSGLINAYKESARLAIAEAQIIEKIVCCKIVLTFDYALLSDVMNAIKKLNFEVTHKDFVENARIELSIPEDEVPFFWLAFKAAVLKIDESEATTIKHIGGLEWKIIAE
ncbi:MAG: IMPACT family protein [Saprospiraceae bacterium]